MGRGRGLSVDSLELLPDVVVRFQEGASMASLARRYRVTVQTIERLLRHALLARGRVI